MGWVIVGLGNPGEEYTATRHNAGRMAVEYFAKSLKSGEFREDTKAKAHVAGVMVGPATAGRGKSAAALVLPDTFMNKSGSALLKFVKSVKAAERLVVVYDDLDLPLGKVKLSYDRGSGGHKGLESVMRALKTKSSRACASASRPRPRAARCASPKGTRSSSISSSPNSARMSSKN